MTVVECYEKIGNYAEAKRRFSRDERIEKYLRKFLADSSFSMFMQEIEKPDYPNAFLHIHNLKGLYSNLAMDRVMGCTERLCEELRDGEPKGDLTVLVRELKECHGQIVERIETLLQESVAEESA